VSYCAIQIGEPHHTATKLHLNLLSCRFHNLVTSEGAIILVEHGKLTMEDCSVSRCAAKSTILVTRLGNRAVLRNCQITQNSGAAIVAHDGALVDIEGSATDISYNAAGVIATFSHPQGYSNDGVHRCWRLYPALASMIRIHLPPSSAVVCNNGHGGRSQGLSAQKMYGTHGMPIYGTNYIRSKATWRRQTNSCSFRQVCPGIIANVGAEAEAEFRAIRRKRQQARALSQDEVDASQREDKRQRAAAPLRVCTECGRECHRGGFSAAQWKNHTKHRYLVGDPTSANPTGVWRTRKLWNASRCVMCMWGGLDGQFPNAAREQYPFVSVLLTSFSY
jgi:hypothetical protein